MTSKIEFVADIIGYLSVSAQLTNTRALALVGDPEAGAYELFFCFSTPEDKDQFPDLVRSNEDMGSEYIEYDFISLTTKEIRDARPLVVVLPEDIVSRATLIASAHSQCWCRRRFLGVVGGYSLRR